jgi:uncharacterized protein YndB with AHSA1/START domain
MSDETKYEHRGRIIRGEMRTSATPEQAWEAWADPEKIAGWFVDRASGEGKTGGTMTWFFDEFGYALPYQVVESVPGKLFVLKWDPPVGDAGILEVRIEREGGATVLRLVNSGFKEGAQWEDEYEGVNSGWKMALAILKEYLENYFGRKKTSLLIMRPASFAYEELLGYFQDGPKLAEWIAKTGTIGKPGEAVKLELRDAGRLTGRVLAMTEREVTVSWEEIGGTLEFKAFAMGPQRMAGLRVMSWKLDAEAAAELKNKLQGSVERLGGIFPGGAMPAEPATGNA